jgi:hypothetical protein
MEMALTQELDSHGWIPRLVGSLNLFFAAIGLLALAVNVAGHSRLPASVLNEPEYVARLYSPMSAVSLALLALLGWSGIALLRHKSYARRLCAIVFAGELACFAAFALAWPLSFSPMYLLLRVVEGFPNVGLALQAVTLYPLWGLLALQTARENR